MSRSSRERALRAKELWPDLWQFLGAYLHEDWPEIHGTPESALDQAIRDYSLGARQKVASQWWNWNATEGCKFDPRPAINDGLGIAMTFESAEAARRFMNSIYDKLIVSIRQEAKGWKP